MSGRTGSLVLLHDPGVLATRTGEIARLLSNVLDKPMQDVAQRVRYGGGIVARDLPDDTATEVARALRAAKVDVFVVSAEERIVALPRTRRLAGITIGDAGLVGTIRGSTKREDLPWSRVRAVHVDAFARELSPEEVEEGRPARPLPDVERVPEEVCRLTAEIDLWEDRERNRRVELCLDVVADEPLLVARIMADDADYSSLPDKADSALANFVLLVRKLLDALPAKVVVPPPTRLFAKTLDWKSVLVDKPEQRDSFNLWFMEAVRHGRPFALDAEPAEDVADDELEDAEEAVVVGEDEDASDAEDLADDEALDADTDDVEDEAEEGPTQAPPAGADAEVVQALEHFDKTRKLRKADVAELVAAAQEIDDKAVETDEVPPASVEAELQFFEEKKTGRWDVSEMVKDSQGLDDKDVADEKHDPGA